MVTILQPSSSPTATCNAFKVIQRLFQWKSLLSWTSFQPNKINRNKKKPEKMRASTGFESVTSTIPVQCSTNWAMYEATNWEQGQFIEFIQCISVRSETMWSIYEIIHIWTVVEDESEEWSSQEGSNPWSPNFFRLFLFNCLNWKIYCDDHFSLSSTTAVQIYELFRIYFT